MKRIFLVLISAFAFIFSPMPLALAADTSAPLLVDWSLQTVNADISTSSRTVSVKFILSIGLSSDFLMKYSVLKILISK
jgi:hypothetical protein